MHTQEKWTTKKSEEIVELVESSIYGQVTDESGNWIATIVNKEAAKHIVQMHNSFDNLLEACKHALKEIKNLNMEDDYPFLRLSLPKKKLKQAIAKAEG